MKPFNPNQHQAKKRFGQNFLTDQGIIDRIVKGIQPKQGDNLLEIGPGLGALTRHVLPSVGKMTVIELDHDVIPKLKFNCDGLGELDIVQQDALKADFSQFAQEKPLRVIGNLPYNISTPILFHLFKHLEVSDENQGIQDMHFMLQKEVIDRIVAQPGSKAFGRLTVMTRYYCDAQYLFTVPPSAFSPPPKVDSAIVRLTPKRERLPLEDYAVFSAMVSEAFNMRRKTVRNVWKKRLDDQAFESLGILPTLRPENLNLENFVDAANWVSRNSSR
ncbi:16S rRNA (adenine(1518)-N(6)/adenine(1519)-N(6))-dimethyltransferase RsmA [Aliikangiella marina]|uniref:Ribosomal RNA small subunit methyltransferase A n=1 Tax=Aliikangiella marina TaxID=1712262 RepID=A0A545TCE3_9GAMM|nr:16S rRNA (adenine(1518)-N(6)/adenine(1519)-N(6))-dimethyltransferase RsmA [Aliikangiella marina]TQV74856.1 16S rRNA (adenine(1518)-N(6)/adenine(1519)-N(6))-dimethyltransferase RsmA [Aliikangiella marina]